MVATMTADPNPQKSKVISSIWGGGNTPKIVKMCIWKAMENRLPTKDNLGRLSLLEQAGTNCSFCQSNTETADHLFIGCETSWKVWGVVCDW